MIKKICCIALSTLFGVGVAIAAPQSQEQAAPAQAVPPQGTQDTGRGEGRHRQFDPNRQLQQLSERLNLTEDQQKQLLPILTSRRQQIESLRSDNSLSAPDRQAKMRSIRAEGDAQIKALLNDTQKQTYEKLQQQMREREQQRREQRQGKGKL